MIKLFRRIWALYGLLVFVVELIIFFPLYIIFFIIFPKKGVDWSVWWSHHVFARIFFILTLIRIRSHGLDQVDLQRSYIILSNHSSSVDFMANAYAYPGVYRYLVKKEILKIPLMGAIIKRISVAVDRKDKESRNKSVENLRNILDQGYSIFLYPEGTRNRTQQPLAPFHKGAFRIALETGTPILFQTLVNVKDISDASKVVDLSPGVLHIVWEKPIETRDMHMDQLPELMDLVRNRMLTHLEAGKRAVIEK